MSIVILRNNIRMNNKTVGGSIRSMHIKKNEDEVDLSTATSEAIPTMKFIKPHNTIGGPADTVVKAIHRKIDGGSFLENVSCGKRSKKKRNNINFKTVK